jgi:hypothetical protein
VIGEERGFDRKIGKLRKEGEDSLPDLLIFL